MMDTYQQATENLVQSFGLLTESAGFSRMTGQIYALLYMSPSQLSLGEIAEKLGASKGTISLNTTSMERWGMIKRFNRPADRRDYYEADTDFWKVIRSILRNREKKLINDFKSSLSGSIKELKKCSNDEESRFYITRLQHMQDFTNTFIRMLNAYLAMEKLNPGRLAMAGSTKPGDEDED
jgi:DNA-binding transcriptional regulator GbsR (MarR family)